MGSGFDVAQIGGAAFILLFTFGMGGIIAWAIVLLQRASRASAIATAAGMTAIGYLNKDSTSVVGLEFRPDAPRPQGGREMYVDAKLWLIHGAARTPMSPEEVWAAAKSGAMRWYSVGNTPYGHNRFGALVRANSQSHPDLLFSLENRRQRIGLVIIPIVIVLVLIALFEYGVIGHKWF